MNLKHVWCGFSKGLREFYYAPYRRTLARTYRDEKDILMLMVFAERLGIPNPTSFYMMELQPILLEDFHQWHLRMGIEKSPLDYGLGCC